MNDANKNTANSARLAKVIARAGLCSRRQAEQWISAGRVSVNGNLVRTPAFNVSESDEIEVDKKLINARAGTRLWLYHKPVGLVVSEKDPEGRKTVFEDLAKHGLPRVLSVGRLDINTEGLLLLTNDGGLKRVLELPATGWLRRYRVRAHGRISQIRLDKLKDGMEVDGVKYGSIDAKLESSKGANIWVNVALREGKNREIKNIFAALGLQVNRLIRTSYGPFQLNDLPMGAVNVVKSKILKEQLGKKLAEQAGVDFDSPVPDETVFDEAQAALNPNKRMGRKPKKPLAPPAPAQAKGNVGAVEDATDGQAKIRKAAPYRKGIFEYRQRPEYVKEEIEKKVVHFSGVRGKEEFIPKAKRKKPEEEEGGFERKGAFGRISGGRGGSRDGGSPRDGGGYKGGRGDKDDKPRRFADKDDRGERSARGERSDRGDRPSGGKSFGTKSFGKGKPPFKSGFKRPSKTRK
jgi:23S rRNA pseudouridine2605 synthase